MSFSAKLRLRRPIEALILRRRLSRIEAGSAAARVYARVAAQLLRDMKLIEASDVIETGIALFPTDFDLILIQARIAVHRQQHDRAKLLWEQIRDRRPDLPEAWSLVARLQMEHRQFDEASATLAEASRRFPGHVEIVAEGARLHDYRGLPAEALILWRELLSKHPDNAEFWRGCTYNLIQLKQLDEAGSVLKTALTKYPADRALMAVSGSLAMAREDWDGALAIWKAFRVRFPDDATGWENLGKTLTSKHLSDIDQGRLAANDRPVEVGRVEDEDIRRLLLGFESLGADCEFGMVQRRYGAEPLGLLRWNAVALESLIAALAARFDRMGDPDQTEFWPGQAAELYLQDKRWGFAMHTFLSSKTTDQDALFPKMCKRIAYLRDKLIDDLVAAEKTFVFKTKNIAVDDLTALHLGLRRFGPVRLLCVVVADPAAPDPFTGSAGEVREIRPGLYIGFISRLGGAQGFWNIAYDDWVAICRGLCP